MVCDVFICSLSAWGFGYAMHYAETNRLKLTYLWASVALSLFFVGFFKYANFFAGNYAMLVGDRDWQPYDIVLPVGISFFTFQAMSYNIDLYRGNVQLCRSPVKFFLFISFFPQLVAGPIVRASSFLPQLQVPVHLTRENLIIGAQIFLGGAIQKVLFADNLSIFVDRVYESPEIYTTGTLWLAVFAYGMQIFCDFSGYSLMAIGIARILGFTLPENFRMPYISTSVTEFWRRWHISLSTWLRDYLYISLGGNRKGVTRTQVNMMITMVLGGLWHGASWNFVIWGALHGLALAVNRGWTVWTKGRFEIPEAWSPVTRLVSWALTLLFVLLAWVPFRSPDFATTQEMFAGLFSSSATGDIHWLHAPTVVILLLAVAWHLAYRFWPQIIESLPFDTARIQSVQAMTALVFSVLVIFIFAPINASPFIYFQF